MVRKKKGKKQPIYNYDFDRIERHCEEEYETNEERIEYLIAVRNEKKLHPPMPDPTIGAPGPPFEEKIEIKIKQYERNIELEQTRLYKNKIVWLKKREDFAAIIEILANNNFIPDYSQFNKVISTHFAWTTGEMTSEDLRWARNNYKNKPETYRLSKELLAVAEQLKSVVNCG